MDLPKHPAPEPGLEDTLPLSKPDDIVERASSSEAQRIPRRIGPYHLLEPLGEGGMGEVWLAEQTEPVRRRVAVKLIKAGLDTRAVISRFESERQALGLMDHPAIARVLDAGTTPEGRPYFVMDHVDGVRLSLFCDTEQLSIHERLELFCQICDAVQHAHQKAIIHRDLKPSNILVARVDGKPRPKTSTSGSPRPPPGSISPGAPSSPRSARCLEPRST